MRILYFLLVSVSICFANSVNTLQDPKELLNSNRFEDLSGIIAQGDIVKLNKLLSGFPAGKRVDSIKSTYGTDTTVYKFTFNAVGFVTQYIAYKAGSLYKKGEYDYNATGKVLSSATYDWISSAWSNYSKTLYTYYDDDRVKSATSFSGSGSQWTNSGRNTYTYNPAGFVFSIIYETWTSDSWVNYTKTESLYNQYNDITKKSYYSWKSLAWVLVAEDLYKYDVSRNNTLKETYSYSGGEIYGGSKDSMSYNAQNKITALIKLNYYNYEWVNNRRTIYDYDSWGNNTAQQNDVWSNSEWRKSSLANYTYNSKNLLTERVTKAWRDTVWVNSGRDTYSYNPAGKILTNIFELFNENAWAKLYFAKYEFDSSDSVLIRLHIDSWIVGNSSLGSWFTQINIDNNWLKSFDVGGYDVNVYYTTVPIPVELSSFIATAKNGTVLLNWKTSTETNNKGFFVDRKISNGNWQTMGFVNGRGTTSELCSYSYTDNTSKSGDLFYRLRQVDFDGTEKLSNEVKVYLGNSYDFDLMQNYPNPFNPSTIISYSVPEECNVKINIYNTTGQLVKELFNGVKSAGSYKIKLDASMLSSGIYFYSIETTNSKNLKGNRLIRKMNLVK